LFNNLSFIFTIPLKIRGEWRDIQRYKSQNQTVALIVEVEANVDNTHLGISDIFLRGFLFNNQDFICAASQSSEEKETRRGTIVRGTGC
jgi:hypothetical protein